MKYLDSKGNMVDTQLHLKVAFVFTSFFTENLLDLLLEDIFLPPLYRESVSDGGLRRQARHARLKIHLHHISTCAFWGVMNYKSCYTDVIAQSDAEWHITSCD